MLLSAVVYAGTGIPQDFPSIPAASEFRQAIPSASLRSGNARVDGSREIVWDLLPREIAAALPGDYYRGHGMLLSTPGTGLAASQHGPFYFSSINPTYVDTFRAFSGHELFSPLGSTATDVTFTVPATDLAATVSGFGVVFCDVDGANNATLEFFTPGGQSLGVFAAPRLDGGWSFLGVRFDAGERVARVRITSGNTPLGPDDGGAAADVVVMDNFIFAEPQPDVPNLYRFDRGGDGESWSDPRNWQPDVVPAQGAVIELPGGQSTYDLPPTTEFDRLLNTGGHTVKAAPGAPRTLGLRNGIRSTARLAVERDLTLDLRGPQTFYLDGKYVERASLHMRGSGIRLNGHDLTLDGARANDYVELYGFNSDGQAQVLIDGSLGGRLIHNGQGSVSIGGFETQLSAVTFPREVVINAGRLALVSGRFTLPATSVLLTGGTFDPAGSTTGSFRATGGTLAVDNSYPNSNYTVTGNLSMTPAATFAALRPVRVNGLVDLGGAALGRGLTGTFGSAVTIIENDGVDPVVGTFAGVPEGGVISANRQVYRVTYRGGDGNDVALTNVAQGDFRPPNQVRVQFAGGDVAAPGLGREDLAIVNWSRGITVDVAQSDFTYDPATQTATWTFRSPLPDGEYHATLGGDAIAGPQPAQFRFFFFVLNGDVNRDRTVNGADFALLAGNFGRSGVTYGQGDLNGDGSVNGTDFSLLAASFGRTMPYPTTVPYFPVRADAPAPASAPAAAPAAAPASPPLQGAAPVSANSRRAVRQSARPATLGATPTALVQITRHARLRQPRG